MAKRNIMRIELSGSAKKKLETLSDHHGMTQVAMMSRLVEWMTQQDESIPGQIMINADRALVAREILKRMASKV